MSFFVIFWINLLDMINIFDKLFIEDGVSLGREILEVALH